MAERRRKRNNNNSNNSSSNQNNHKNHNSSENDDSNNTQLAHRCEKCSSVFSRKYKYGFDTEMGAINSVDLTLNLG